MGTGTLPPPAAAGKAGMTGCGPEHRPRLQQYAAHLAQKAAAAGEMTPDWQQWIDDIEPPSDAEGCLQLLEELVGRDDLPAEIAQLLHTELTEVLASLGGDGASADASPGDGYNDATDTAIPVAGKSLALGGAPGAGAGEGMMEVSQAILDQLAESAATKAAEVAVAAAEQRFKALLEAEPAIKHVPFHVANINTRAPHGDADAHMKSFMAYVREGPEMMDAALWAHLKAVSRHAQAAMKALGEGSDAAGAVLLPEPLARELVHSAEELSWIRKLKCHRYGMTSKTLDVPRVTDGDEADIVEELATTPEEEPTLDNVRLTAITLRQIALASLEMLGDTGFDVWGQVVRPNLARAFAKAENRYFSRGTGTNQPQGATVGATLGKTFAAATFSNFDEIKDLFFSVPHQWRDDPSCAWSMQDATWQEICQLKDGQGRSYVNQDESKEVRVLLGKPVQLNSGMPAMGSGNRSIVVGAWECYGIGDRSFAGVPGASQMGGAGIMVRRLNEAYAKQFAVGFLGFKRVDGRVMQTEGLRYGIHT